MAASKPCRGSEHCGTIQQHEHCSHHGTTALQQQPLHLARFCAALSEALVAASRPCSRCACYSGV